MVSNDGGSKECGPLSVVMEPLGSQIGERTFWQRYDLVPSLHNLGQPEKNYKKKTGHPIRRTIDNVNFFNLS